ncbi:MULTISPECIES: ABC transporter ATP-binding protein [Mameliella]|uniref:ABC transporter ATP-binding protein n=1 Tax=Mameliella TaxID=1434019 RepID=UPI000B534F85|nr:MULTISPECIES: ABC transporter ATP-binding protein [Mameliella]MCR9275128.1 ABC transporter ATP-binding protein [Paracoccaceae bacterium]OWV52412.1 ABC transporter ATP-binding protein [Mameliella alba]
MALPLEIKDLEVRAGTRTLLRVGDLSAPAGALIGIRGPSGAGKSTFLHALSGLIEVRGRLCWGEVDLTRLRPERRTVFRSENMGLIFQDFLLFEELSPQANAGLSGLFRTRHDRAPIATRAAEALARLAVPEGNRKVGSFSGGERQRVAIARALATDPGLLLADEPTASLDRRAADALIEDLTGLARAGGKTLIAVSHDAHLLERLDRVLTIEDGKVTDDTGVQAA